MNDEQNIGFDVGQFVIITHDTFGLLGLGEVYRIISEPFIWFGGLRYESPHVGKLKMKSNSNNLNGYKVQCLDKWVESKVFPGSDLFIIHPVAWMRPYENPDTWIVTERDRVLET